MAALLAAVEARSTIMVQAYIDGHAGPAAQVINAVQALHAACAFGDARCALLLHSHGANLELLDNAGRTPFDGATEECRRELASLSPSVAVSLSRLRSPPPPHFKSATTTTLTLCLAAPSRQDRQDFVFRVQVAEVIAGDIAMDTALHWWTTTLATSGNGNDRSHTLFHLDPDCCFRIRTAIRTPVGWSAYSNGCDMRTIRDSTTTRTSATSTAACEWREAVNIALSSLSIRAAHDKFKNTVAVRHYQGLMARDCHNAALSTDRTDTCKSRLERTNVAQSSVGDKRPSVMLHTETETMLEATDDQAVSLQVASDRANAAPAQQSARPSSGRSEANGCSSAASNGLGFWGKPLKTRHRNNTIPLAVAVEISHPTPRQGHQAKVVMLSPSRQAGLSSLQSSAALLQAITEPECAISLESPSIMAPVTSTNSVSPAPRAPLEVQPNEHHCKIIVSAPITDNAVSHELTGEMNEQATKVVIEAKHTAESIAMKSGDALVKLGVAALESMGARFAEALRVTNEALLHARHTFASQPP